MQRYVKNFKFPNVPSLINIEKVKNTDHSYNAAFSSTSSFSNIAGVYDYANKLNGSPQDNYRRYSISNEDSFSITMNKSYDNTYNGETSEYSYSNYRFFLLNDCLAGYMTTEYSVNDGKTVDDALPSVIVKKASMIPSSDGKKLNISIIMDTTSYNPWNVYDTIIVQYSNTGRRPVTLIVNQDAETFDISIDFTPTRYVNFATIKLTGFTQNKMSPDYSYSYGNAYYNIGIPSSEPEIFDTIKPCEHSTGTGYKSLSAIYTTPFLTIPKRYDYMIPIDVLDYETGLKTINVNANGHIWNYSLDDFFCPQDNEHTNGIEFINQEGIHDTTYAACAIIPIWDVDEEVNNLLLNFYDNQNNCYEWKGNFTSIKIPSFSVESGTTNTLVSEATAYTLYQWRLGIAKLNSTDNTWSKHSDVTTTPAVTTGPDGAHIYTYSGLSLPSDSFVKIVATAALEDTWLSTNFGHSVPLYFYTGSKQNSGNYDYFTPNGREKYSLRVVSDAPAFVHTIVTKYPLDECQNWTVADWEHNHKHIGDKYMNFNPDTNSEPIPQKYNIPVNQMDQGDCFVVIAHFADGTSCMSDVMVKE